MSIYSKVRAKLDALSQQIVYYVEKVHIYGRFQHKFKEMPQMGGRLY